ncbi:MAG: hypothetical protein ABJL99_02340 [Aliishimia sp.]
MPTLPSYLAENDPPKNQSVPDLAIKLTDKISLLSRSKHHYILHKYCTHENYGIIVASLFTKAL